MRATGLVGVAGLLAAHVACTPITPITPDDSEATDDSASVDGDRPCFADPDCGGVQVVLHRAGMRTAPENTVAAIAHAATLGVDGVELDVRTTSDGVLVLMHDNGVTRTTDGTGSVASLTAAEVAALTIPSRFDGIPDQRVPTLREALTAVAATSMYAELDIKDAPAATLMADVRATGMTDRVVLITQTVGLGTAYRQADGDVSIMPLIGNAGQVDDYASLHPEMFEVTAAGLAATASTARAAGSRVLTHVLGEEPGRSADDSLPTRYGELCDQGAQTILTDYPEVLLPALADGVCD